MSGASADRVQFCGTQWWSYLKVVTVSGRRVPDVFISGTWIKILFLKDSWRKFWKLRQMDIRKCTYISHLGWRKRIINQLMITDFPSLISMDIFLSITHLCDMGQIDVLLHRNWRHILFSNKNVKYQLKFDKDLNHKILD